MTNNHNKQDQTIVLGVSNECNVQENNEKSFKIIWKVCIKLRTAIQLYHEALSVSAFAGSVTFCCIPRGLEYHSSESFKHQPHKLVKHTQTNCRLLPTNCLSAFGHFVGLALKRLIQADTRTASLFSFLYYYC